MTQDLEQRVAEAMAKTIKIDFNTKQTTWREYVESYKAPASEILKAIAPEVRGLVEDNKEANYIISQLYLILKDIKFDDWNAILPKAKEWLEADLKALSNLPEEWKV